MYSGHHPNVAKATDERVTLREIPWLRRFTLKSHCKKGSEEPKDEYREAHSAKSYIGAFSAQAPKKEADRYFGGAMASEEQEIGCIQSLS